MICNPPINRLDLYRLALPLITPWQTAYGTESIVETIYVKASSDQHSAWFESCPLRSPTYMPDCAAGTFATIRAHLGKRILGCNSPEAARSALADVRGNTHARNLLEGAAWALAATANNRTLAEAIGAAPRTPTAGLTLSLRQPQNALNETIEANPERQIRFKFSSPSDITNLQKVRQHFPNQAVLIDCNAAFSFDDLPLLNELDKLNLACIEQPLHYRDLVGHAQLQEHLNTPICLDESITCLQDAQTAITLKAARVFNLKPGRVGGITELKEILELAQENNLDCFIGGMLETQLGASLNRALATLPGITRPSDLPDPATRYATLPAEPISAEALEPFVIEQAIIAR